MRNLFSAMLLVTFATPAFAAAPVTGRWLTTEKDSIIEIGQCGATVCGKIAKILRPTKDGKPPFDTNNPNPALRTRPIDGLVILSGFVANGQSWKGSIYDPRAGKTYTSYLTKLANGNLKVQGCVGPFCKSFVYTPTN
ncbi:MAG: DUF2147 domain-containing protein [Sphingomonadaceae bacterium]